MEPAKNYWVTRISPGLYINRTPNTFFFLRLHILNPLEEHVTKKAKTYLRDSKGRIAYLMVLSVTKPIMAVNNVYFTEIQAPGGLRVPHQLTH